MKIDFNRFVNATKTFPLEFEDDSCNGEDTVYIESAYMYETSGEALDGLDRYDEPDSRQILKVRVSYEF